MKRYEETRYEYIFRNVQSGKYYFRGTIESKFIERSLKTKQISQAKERADLIRKSPSEFQTKEKRHTFDELFSSLLEVQAPKAKETYDNTYYSIRHLRPWFIANCPYIHSFEKNFQRVWAAYKNDQKLLTPGRDLSHDKRYLIMALRHGYSKGEVKRFFEGKNLDLKSVKKSIGKHLEDIELQPLLNSLKEREPKIYLQALMAATMGMRKKEILQLRKEEIDLIERVIHLDPERIKTRMQRKVPIPIPDVVFSRLREAYIAAPGVYIFPKIYTNKKGQPVSPNEPQTDNRHHWRQVKKALGIVARFHDLRHTAITNALAAGFPQGSASKIFGATVETISKIYDHVKKETANEFRNICDAKFKH